MQTKRNASRLASKSNRKEFFSKPDFPLRVTYSPKPLPPWDLSMLQWEKLWNALSIECLYQVK